MTSSRLETPTNTPGAHRGQHRAPHSSHAAPKPPARYEPHLDGLFTYCLSVLCDHDAATEALGGVLALAERQGSRCPAGEEERKTWLYALARWTCLRRLTEQKQGRRAHRRPDPARPPHRRSADEDRRTPTAARPARRAARPASPAAHTAASATPEAPESAPAAEAHRRELARLAWPEAAGTTPEQREALELAVRHGLTPHAVAAVLGLAPTAARELLAGAACEVERTRAALAVVETGNCPTAARLTGDHRALLSPTLRRELVRHVDDCPRCRRAAERAGAEAPWPGKTVAPAAALPVVEAPRPSAYVAMLHARKHLKNRSATPRFDRTGFPMDPKDHAARRDRLRSRVMTTTVVATVVAAPVIALWSAYRGAPLTGEGRDGSAVSAADNGTGGGAETPYAPYENAGNARPDGGSRFTGDDSLPEVSAEIVSKGADPSRDPAAHGEGRLTVRTRTAGSATLITLTASKAGPVSWTAATDRPWVTLSRTSGRLPAGGSVTIRALVDHARQPAGPWTAHLTVAPSGAVVALHGYGAKAPTPGASPRGLHPRPVPPRTGTPDPEPTPDPSTPTPGPTTPTPTEPDPSPTPDPTGSSGPPAPPKGPSTPPPAN
ncbi:hypothetical protein ACN6LM_004978 [Streptomyces sp. SAS_281]|uniref:hypothetical protein n=1 Tax=Streptomyces sp. SAS_281 TaxID=3412744 RepID=UPI00403D36A1